MTDDLCARLKSLAERWARAQEVHPSLHRVLDGDDPHTERGRYAAGAVWDCARELRAALGEAPAHRCVQCGGRMVPALHCARCGETEVDGPSLIALEREAPATAPAEPPLRRWVEMPFKNGKTGFVDEDDLALISGYAWNATRASSGLWYAQAYRRGSYACGRPANVFMHRIIMDAPKGTKVDHINGNGLDNRRSNLRLCTDSQNHANRHVCVGRGPGGRGSSRYRGVHFRPSKSPGAKQWEATIKCAKQQHYIGRFATEEEAARAYDAKARDLFGEFACLNFGGDAW